MVEFKTDIKANIKRALKVIKNSLHEYPYPYATVGGFIIAPDGDLLLVRSEKWTNHYSLPGGKIEIGETREAAFQREIREETGLEIVNIREAITQDCIFSKEFWDRGHFIFCDFIADLAPGYSKHSVHLNHEAQSYIWIAPREAFKLNLAQETRILLDWYLNDLEKKKQDQAFNEFNSQKNKKKILSGIIHVEKHVLNCFVGIEPKERASKQEIFIDLKVQADLNDAVISDSIHDTICYKNLIEICRKVADMQHYHLIETLANRILDELLSSYPKVNWCWIKITKPEAVEQASGASIEFEKER